MPRFVTYVPQDVLDWIHKSATESKRSPSQFGAIILGNSFEEDTTEVVGVLADKLMNIIPQDTPILSRGRPIKPSFPSPFIDKAGAEE